MQSVQIFTHSVRQVSGNLGPALRISGLLFLMQFALIFVLGAQVVFSPDGGQAMMNTGTYPWGRVVLYFLLSTFTGLWIAVAWHRFVLREEYIGAVIPTWQGGRLWAYFLKTLLIILATFAMGLIVGFLAGLFGALLLRGLVHTRAASVAVGFVFVLLAGLMGLFVTYRLSPALPAAALGEPLSLRDAWRKTSGKGGTILALALISVVVSVTLAKGPIYLFGLHGLPAMVWIAVMQWTNLMVGVSIVTTLYGHYVEGRPLV